MLTEFTPGRINSYNNWGQATNHFFLRRCLLSETLQSFLCNYFIFVISAACKLLFAFTERYCFFFFYSLQLAFFFRANLLSSGIQNIFSALIVYWWGLFEQGAKWPIMSKWIAIWSSVGWHQNSAGVLQPFEDCFMCIIIVIKWSI
jgi:hypothetical protein